MLRIIGLTYLVGVVIDGLLSMIAMALPALEQASNILSLFMYGYGVVVLLLAILGRLRPRAVFIIPVLLYWCLGFAGILTGIVLMFTARVHIPSNQPPGEYLRGILPWYGPLVFSLLCLLLATGAFCLYKYLRSPQWTTSVQSHV